MKWLTMQDGKKAVNMKRVVYMEVVGNSSDGFGLRLWDVLGVRHDSDRNATTRKEAEKALDTLLNQMT